MDDFGPSKKDFEKKGLEGMRTIKDAIEENKRREEELYGPQDLEKVYRGPKPLDAEEVDWIQGKQNEARLKFLERELEDLAELEKFNKDIKKKVYKAESLVTQSSDLDAPTIPVVKKTSKKNPIVAVVPQKRKSDDTDKNIEKEEKKPKTVEKTTSTKPKETEGNTLSALVDYGDDE